MMATTDDSPTNDTQILMVENKEFEQLECPVCLQLCVHPSKLPCGHIFCFLCVKGLKNRRCAMCRAEFPNEFLERPQLLTAPSTSDADHNEYQWFYRGHNGWWQYDERTCLEIEDAYKRAQKQCTILVAGNLYIVDFDQMLQKRQTDPSRKRQVKIDLATIPKKGVAGLRLWNGDSENAEVQNSNISITIAATEAAIQIASDIIDSTLAHADDHHSERTEGRRHFTTTEIAGTSASLSNMPSIERNYEYNVADQDSNRRDMLDEIEETFNITNLSSINTATSQLDDFFSLTLDEFRNLTMNNIADDSSSDENDEDDHV